MYTHNNAHSGAPDHRRTPSTVHDPPMPPPSSAGDTTEEASRSNSTGLGGDLKNKFGVRSSSVVSLLMDAQILCEYEITT